MKVVQFLVSIPFQDDVLRSSHAVDVARQDVAGLVGNEYGNVTVEVYDDQERSEGDYAETCETSEKSIDPSDVPVITLHLGPELGDVQIFDDTLSLPVTLLNPPVAKNVARARLEAILSMLDAPVYQPRYPTYPGAAARRAMGRRYGRNPEEQD